MDDKVCVTRTDGAALKERTTRQHQVPIMLCSRNGGVMGENWDCDEKNSRGHEQVEEVARGEGKGEDTEIDRRIVSGFYVNQVQTL